MTLLSNMNESQLGEFANATSAALSVLPRGYGSLTELLNREGDPIATANRQSYTTFTANVSGPAIVPSPAPGRAIYVQSFQAWSTTPIAGRAQFNSGNSLWSGTGTFPVMDIGFGCGPGYAANVAVNAFIRSADRTGIGAVIPQWLDAGVSGTHVVGISGSAYQLSDSINFDAKKVILWVGDSTSNGTGPTSVLTCVPYQVNKFYRDKGINCRYILKAFSGSTTSGHYWYAEGGKYDFPLVSAIFINLGINDAAQGYTTDGASAGATASMPNIRAQVARYRARYPGVPIVLFGSTPLQNATFEATLAAFRSALSTYCASFSDGLVKFCDLGASFDRTVGANYVTSDGADGTRIHPADQGLLQVLQTGPVSGSTGLLGWLQNNLPTI